MEQDFLPEKGDSIIEVTPDDVKQLLTNDPIYRLQHEKQDKALATSAQSQLSSLLDLKETVSKNDYDQNAALRSALRKRKKHSKELLEEGKSIGLSVPLLDRAESDVIEARQMKYHHQQIDRRKVKEKRKMTSLLTQSIFPSSPALDLTTNHLNTNVHVTKEKDKSNDEDGEWGRQRDKTRAQVDMPSSASNRFLQRQIAINKQSRRRIDTKKLSISENRTLDSTTSRDIACSVVTNAGKRPNSSALLSSINENNLKRSRSLSVSAKEKERVALAEGEQERERERERAISSVANGVTVKEGMGGERKERRWAGSKSTSGRETVISLLASAYEDSDTDGDR
eukprot:CAMPEP_0182418290 /NCGR_PEP_ID=MMETSP1167-20130531/2759_1 /TAXON_ID=2988 /ORGANISM="Mallomonas Sp, Strain CCMP3275" /LENGTH=339 /DNA_ID=CAMNT_0024592433 /DNA_START=457 /DNA_END=1476 /DNA_ORIENTATION=+